MKSPPGVISGGCGGQNKEHLLWWLGGRHLLAAQFGWEAGGTLELPHLPRGHAFTSWSEEEEGEFPAHVPAGKDRWKTTCLQLDTKTHTLKPGVLGMQGMHRE